MSVFWACMHTAGLHMPAPAYPALHAAIWLLLKAMLGQSMQQ